MHALIAVTYPEWNHGHSCKTVHMVFEDFEELVWYTESEDAEEFVERHSKEMDSQTVGWDYICDIQFNEAA